MSTFALFSLLQYSAPIMIEIIKTPDFDAQLVRSLRRRTSSHLTVKQGLVQLRVPFLTPTKTIFDILNKHRQWIVKKLQEPSPPPPTQPSLLQAASFEYLGSRCTLHVRPLKKRMEEPLFLENRLYLSLSTRVKNSELYIKKKLIQWLQKQAHRHLLEKTAFFSDQINVHPTTVLVRSFKSQWGSCSALGKVQYNWKIIRAPEPVLEYLVVHELCHLKHHNHSPAFWDCVARYCPNYKEHRRWLRTQGHTLDILAFS